MVDPGQIMTDAQWSEVLDDLAQRSLMSVLLTDAGGGILRTHGSRNELCERIRADDDSRMAVCSQTNAAMLELVRLTLAPVIEECEAGMLRLVVPVVRGGILVFQVTACGRVAHGGGIEAFLLSRLLQMREDDVAELGRSVTLVARRYVRGLGEEFFERLNPQEGARPRP